MNLSKSTTLLLKQASVDTGMLGNAVERAMEKREEKASRLTETSKAFNGSQSFAIGKLILTDEEQLALQCVAFDAAIQKAVKLWGVFDYSLPEVLGENLPKVFPYTKKPTSVDSVPA